MDEQVECEISWIHFIRQCFICFITVVLFFNCGLYFGAPTVFIPQLRKEANSTNAITIEMESWVSAAVAYSALPWVIILPLLASHYGRRVPSFIMWIFMTASAFTLYFSKSIHEILIGQILQGILPATTTVSVLILTEYSTPKYRGVFMTLKNATFFWGIWTANAIGTFFYWKVILIPIFICCAITMTMAFWPESPYWLASKGRFVECANAHRWLKGTNNDAEKELIQMINIHKGIKSRDVEKLPLRKSICKQLKFVQQDVFYKPIVYGMVVSGLYLYSGKLSCSVYAIGIIRKMTNSEQAAYIGMLVVDGITILGMYTGCVLSNVFNRRTIIIYSSLTGSVVLLILSLYFYLISLSLLTENKYASITLLTLFSLAISCGPVILGPCITGDLAPLKYRSTFVSVNSLLHTFIMATVIKISPYLFEYLELHFSFLIFGVCTVVLTYLVHRYLPETKDKTLIEIQEDVRGPCERNDFETARMLRVVDI